MQPFASYACQVCAPASACIGPFKELQQLQKTFLRRACRVKKSILADIIFQELQQMWWHDFWYKKVTGFWLALVEADASSSHSMIFHDAIQLVQDANSARLPKFSSAPQLWVSPCLWWLMRPSQLISIYSRSCSAGKACGLGQLTSGSQMRPSAGAKLCLYHPRDGRPQNAACPSYWESPI